MSSSFHAHEQQLSLATFFPPRYVMHQTVQGAGQRGKEASSQEGREFSLELDLERLEVQTILGAKTSF